MSFFQNPFDQEFRGNWIIADRQYTLNFNLNPNVNTSTLMMCFSIEPYDMSSNNTLTINYAIDPTLKQFQSRAVNVAGATSSATLASEVASALNGDAIIGALFTASTRSYNDKTRSGNIVYLQSNRPTGSIKAYISNTSAEEELHFNAKAPIAELPSYFARHTIGNALTYTDSYGILLELSPVTSPSYNYDATMISAYGLDPTTIRSDWQLAAGRAGYFMFQEYTYDGSNRVTQVLEFPSGASAGDLATITYYQYTGSSTSPKIVTKVPYTLQSSDISTVVPPA